MRVRIEMDVPDGCKDCPFCHSGVIYEWCKFGGRSQHLSESDYEKRPDSCPLNECTRVVDIEVKINPPIVTDADDDASPRKEADTGYIG